MPKVIQVIESDVLRGDGKSPSSRQRNVRLYHSLEGDVLGESDSLRNRQAEYWERVHQAVEANAGRMVSEEVAFDLLLNRLKEETVMNQENLSERAQAEIGVEMIAMQLENFARHLMGSPSEEARALSINVENAIRCLRGQISG